MRLLWSLNVERGITVVMVTHEADMAAYARRVVRFVDGVVASDQRNARPAGLDAAAPSTAPAIDAAAPQPHAAGAA
jgi:putative ABC transport system ATP-binding protein